MAGAGLVAAVPVAGPDAELIRLCAEIHRLDKEARVAPEIGLRTYRHALNERWDAVDAIAAIRPATREGERANAGVAVLLVEEATGGGTETSSAYEDFALAFLREMAGKRPSSGRRATKATPSRRGWCSGMATAAILGGWC